MNKIHIQLNGQQLKLIAMITMFIDHLTCCFLEIARGPQGQSLMYTFRYGELLDRAGRGIGRIAFPIFCFFVVEGYIWTRNRWKYLGRLLFWGAIAHFPFNWIFFPDSSRPHTDTLFTLALGFLAIWGIDEISQRLLPRRYRPITNGSLRVNAENDADDRGRSSDSEYAGSRSAEENSIERDIGSLGKSAAAGLMIALWVVVICLISREIGSDYRYGGVLTIVIMYVLYRVRDFGLLGSYLWLTYYNEAELLSLPGFILLSTYNGKRGRQNKYLFYIFYPAHLLILYLIRRAIFGR